MAVAGNFTNLKVQTTGVGGGAGIATIVGSDPDAVSVELLINGASCTEEPLICVIAFDQSTCTMDTSTCAVEAGQYVNWEVIVTSDPNNDIVTNWAVEFQATSGYESALIMTTSANTSTNTYYMPIQGDALVKTVYYEYETRAPLDGTISDFFCKLEVAPGGSVSRTYEVRDGGGILDDRLICVITGAETTCGDGVDTSSNPFVKGEFYYIEESKSGGAPVATYITCGLKLTSDTESFMVSGSASDTWTEEESRVTGVGNGNTRTQSHASAWYLSIYQPVAWTATDFYVRLYNDPGAGESWDITLQEDGVDTALTCSIDGAEDYECELPDQSEAIAADSLLTVEFQASSDGVAAPARLHWSAAGSVD
jgi:hypothetical protein